MVKEGSTPIKLMTWMMHKIPMDTGKMLWGKSQEIQKRAESHSNAGDVEDPICTGVVHMGKGM